MARRAAWRRVVFAADCVDLYGDGEVLVCPHCGIDYAECGCPGPHQDDEYDYEERDGALWARPHGDDDRAAVA